MSFSVTRLSECLVGPSEPTPTERLPVSWMDKTCDRVLMRTLHVFKHGEEPAKVIKEGLAKALVPYYPLAGVYVASSDDREQCVDCTGEGAWFVEASANCTLQEVNFMQLPLVIPPEDIFPTHRPGIHPSRVMVMMQVTDFTCGGFVIGLKTNHAIADGLGAAQFITAVSECARGLAHPTVSPIWSRDLVSAPPNMSLNPPPPLPHMNLETSIIDLSLDRITRLKEVVFAESGRRCSTFDIMIAMIWQSRTRAIELQPADSDVHLSFLASARHLFKELIPPEGGYYGNCVSFVNAAAAASRVAHGPLWEVVELILEAKARLPGDFAKFLEGDLTRGAPPPPTYETFVIVDCSRLGFTEVDYGWGTPISVIHMLEVPFVPICLITKALKQDGDQSGIRLTTRLVRKEHLQGFNDQMKSFGKMNIP